MCSRRARFALAVVLGIVLGKPLPAAPVPGLVLDIRLQQGPYSGSVPAGFFQVGKLLYFSARTEEGGQELWTTDGTAQGTRRVRDICPGRCSGTLGFFSALGSIAFLIADDGMHGWELWRTDGTAVGTRMVLNVNSSSRPFYPLPLHAAGDSLLLTVWTEETGYELWRTDGTAAGTVLLKDIHPGPHGSWPSDAVSLGGQVYFAASDAKHGRELWRTDGTAEGTNLVLDLNNGEADGIPFSFSLVPRLLHAGPRGLLFAGDDGLGGVEPWASDGTAAGTRRVADLAPGPASSSPSGFFGAGAVVLFSADDGVHGAELWRTDGSASGTELVADIDPGEGSSAPFGFFGRPDSVLFSADDAAHGRELWRYGPGGVELLGDLSPGPTGSEPLGFEELGELVLFIARDEARGGEIWRTDGTAPGTGPLADLNPGPGNGVLRVFAPTTGVASLARLGEQVLFAGAESTAYEWELFTTAGTAETTRLLADLSPDAASSNPRRLVALGEILLFTAEDDGSGEELWRSRGGAGDTELVLDVWPGDAPSQPRELTALGDRLFFTAADPAHGRELWRSDGTAAGTVLFRDLLTGVEGSNPGNLTAAGDRLFFTIRPSGSASRLFVTDGLDPACSPLGFGDGPLRAVGERLFFVRGASGELAVSDGSASGTFVPRPLAAGGPYRPRSLLGVGDRLFFTAETHSAGRELWVSDGTLEGTRLVREIHPGAAGFDPDAVEMAALGPRAVFAANDGEHGVELWVSDGTREGTHLLRDIHPGLPASEPRSLTTVGDRAFFAARDADHGDELWVTDGTPAGTARVRDIRPGPDSSVPRRLRAVDGLLYFAARGDELGVEPWVSDGTAPGTVAVADVHPGALSSSPEEFTVAAERLFFSAHAPESGRELWVMDLAAGGAESVADLAIGKTDSKSAVLAGETLTYVIELRNEGPDDVLAASVADTVPAPLSCSWTCAAEAGASCLAGTLDGDLVDSADLPDASAVVYTGACDVQESFAGTVVNTVSVTPPAGVTDPDAANDSDTDETEVVDCPEELTLANRGIAGSGLYAAATSVTLGPELTVDGDWIEVLAGLQVALHDGTEIAGGFVAATVADACLAALSVHTPGGLALAFDGVEDLVRVPHVDELTLLDSFTIEGWVRLAEQPPVGAQLPLLSKGLNFGNYTSRVFVRDNPYRINASHVHRTAAGNYSASGGAVEHGVWTHLAWTYSEPEQTLTSYVDGELQRSVVNVTPPVGNLEDLFFGHSPFTSLAHHLSGELDEIRIWNVVRTAVQIASDYDRRVDPAAAGLVGYWSFDERLLPQTVLDSTSGDNHGTLGLDADPGDDDPRRVLSGAPLQ